VRISLIAAATEAGVIGVNGGLPWHLPADLKRFKHITLGHHLIMGRRTFDSIGKPLPGRTSLVLTRSAPAAQSASDEAVRRVDSLAQALDVARAAGETEAFVIGGGEIFALALPLAERIYLTRVDAEIEGDTTIPSLDPGLWQEVAREEHPADERHAFAFAMTVLERRRA
jgi:dihydrofolate reductase